MALAITMLACSKQPKQHIPTIENAEPQISRVEPLSWWIDMNTPLTLMFYGHDLQDAQVTVSPNDGIRIKSQHNAESKNYLFVDVDILKAGNYTFTLRQGDKTVNYNYTINERRPESRNRQGFTSADLIYLIMSDRFVDGDTTNNSTDDTLEPADKTNVHGRFGGDIQGIINTIDHVVSIGATAIWPTPLLLDNEPRWSYHGYACSDYYHIDPRFGSNEQYQQMVAIAHEKGIKVLMDMVPNHCGGAHWWMQDLPFNDWINQFDNFTNTNNVFSANYDINASEYDRQLSNRGWFDRPMPDMNLENPDLLQYFKQWAIWWIEYADLDGLRVDTYPYIEKLPAADWCKAIMDEYPNFNIVGECWTRPASAVAYWQANALNYDGFNSNLPSVMDFPTEEAIRQALENDNNYWGGGLTKVYDAVAQDYLYADVNKLLLFLTNHDMDRFADVVKDMDIRRVKLGMVMLATMRGIPQLLYGEEYNLHSTDRSLGHSTLRMPMPAENDLTAENKDMETFVSHLFNWRKNEPVIHNGRTLHFLSRDNTYAYFRYNNDEAVFVFLNANDHPKTIPASHYAEILNKYNPLGEDIMTGNSFDFSGENTVDALSYKIIKMHK